MECRVKFVSCNNLSNETEVYAQRAFFKKYLYVYFRLTKYNELCSLQALRKQDVQSTIYVAMALL